MLLLSHPVQDWRASYSVREDSIFRSTESLADASDPNKLAMSFIELFWVTVLFKIPVKWIQARCSICLAHNWSRCNSVGSLMIQVNVVRVIPFDGWIRGVMFIGANLKYSLRAWMIQGHWPCMYPDPRHSHLSNPLRQRPIHPLCESKAFADQLEGGLQLIRGRVVSSSITFLLSPFS